MWLALVIASLSFSPAMATDKAFKKPWFCHDLDCPPYEVKESNNDYELRSYEAGKWVSTVEEGFGYSEAVRKGFWKLFKYIGGKNGDKQKIAMTAPVRVLVHPSQGPFCESNFTVSFYVPSKFQEDVPEPSDSDVFVESTPAFNAYVVSYGGWQSTSEFTTHAAALGTKLQDEGIAVREDEYYAVGYDSPFRLLNRHNEVWLIAQDDADTAAAEADLPLQTPRATRKSDLQSLSA